MKHKEHYRTAVYATPFHPRTASLIVPSGAFPHEGRIVHDLAERQAPARLETDDVDLLLGQLVRHGRAASPGPDHDDHAIVPELVAATHESSRGSQSIASNPRWR